MCQLIDSRVKIYFCDLKTYVDITNYSSYFCHHVDNAALIKIITGDNSDTIKGVKGVKEPTLLSFFPELKERKVTLTEIRDKASKLQTERIEAKKGPLKSLQNIIDGVTDGVQGDKLYEINTALVDLKNPLMTENAIQSLNDLIEGEFDVNTRNIKNVFVQMKKDGLEKTIGVNRYDEYLIPFKQLIERELKHSQ